MRLIFLRTFVFWTSLGLVACTTTDDPSEGGFFDGVAGIFSGTYDQRSCGNAR